MQSARRSEKSQRDPLAQLLLPVCKMLHRRSFHGLGFAHPTGQSSMNSYSVPSWARRRSVRSRGAGGIGVSVSEEHAHPSRLRCVARACARSALLMRCPAGAVFVTACRARVRVRCARDCELPGLRAFGSLEPRPLRWLVRAAVPARHRARSEAAAGRAGPAWAAAPLGSAPLSPWQARLGRRHREACPGPGEPVGRCECFPASARGPRPGQRGPAGRARRAVRDEPRFGSIPAARKVRKFDSRLGFQRATRDQCAGSLWIEPL
jgi:hypothetical protein